MALLGALGHLANLGQLVDVGQGRAQHREQVRWSRQNYVLDAQALKIDLLGAARDDVRGTYDTYIERLDTLLLLNALLLPFALNTLQFSDEFVPQTEEQCADCVEAVHPWLATLWVYLVGSCLVLPFWSLLLLLRCKLRLDSWLQETLDELQRVRRELLQPEHAGSDFDFKSGGVEFVAEAQEQVVGRLCTFIVNNQDLFAELWTGHCAPLVFCATRLLWSSACGAIALTGLMFWIFLVNRPGRQNSAHAHFLVLLLIGLGAPFLYFLCNYCRKVGPTAVRRGAAWPAAAGAAAGGAAAGPALGPCAGAARRPPRGPPPGLARPGAVGELPALPRHASPGAWSRLSGGVASEGLRAALRMETSRSGDSQCSTGPPSSGWSTSDELRLG